MTVRILLVLVLATATARRTLAQACGDPIDVGGGIKVISSDGSDGLTMRVEDAQNQTRGGIRINENSFPPSYFALNGFRFNSAADASSFLASVIADAGGTDGQRVADQAVAAAEAGTDGCGLHTAAGAPAPPPDPFADTDGDGWPDAAEGDFGSNPNDPADVPTDADGWEFLRAENVVDGEGFDDSADLVFTRGGVTLTVTRVPNANGGASTLRWRDSEGRSGYGPPPGGDPFEDQFLPYRFRNDVGSPLPNFGGPNAPPPDRPSGTGVTHSGPTDPTNDLAGVGDAVESARRDANATGRALLDAAGSAHDQRDSAAAARAAQLAELKEQTRALRAIAGRPVAGYPAGRGGGSSNGDGAEAGTTPGDGSGFGLTGTGTVADVSSLGSFNVSAVSLPGITIATGGTQTLTLSAADALNSSLLTVWQPVVRAIILLVLVGGFVAAVLRDVFTA